MGNYQRLTMDRTLISAPIACGGTPAETYVGMAHFAGGTPGKFCRQCHFHGMSSGKKMSRVPADGIKAMVCQKARQMGCKTTQKVPSTASACKYFEAKR